MNLFLTFHFYKRRNQKEAICVHSVVAQIWVVPESELPQVCAGVAGHPEHVVADQAAQVQGHQVGQSGQAVCDQVEVMLQQLFALGDVIVLTLY